MFKIAAFYLYCPIFHQQALCMEVYSTLLGIGACVCSRTTKILVVLDLLYLLLRPTNKKRVLGFLREKSSSELVGKPRVFIQQADLL